MACVWPPQVITMTTTEEQVSGSQLLCDWLAKGIRISEALNAEQKAPPSAPAPEAPQPECGFRKLPLSKKGPKHKGTFALVSSDMWEYVSRHRWSVMGQKNKTYACRKVNHKTIALHRYIYNRLVELGQKPALLDGQVVDHIDEDGLNNTNANLQPLTHGDNTKKGRAHKGMNVTSTPVRNGKFKKVEKHIYPGNNNPGSGFLVIVRGKYIGTLPSLAEARIFRDMAKKKGVEAAKQLLRERYN